jgi:serine/threonine-protein kinase
MDDVVRLPRYILTSTVPEQSVHSSQLIPVGAGVPQLGELVAGKYRIEGTLGLGGMGVVLAARNELIGQSVAIKFLVVNDEEYLGEATQRLLREARAAAQLRGEHVVRIYDVGELPNGTPFIVMERLHGRDLGEISSMLGKMPIPIAVSFVAQAARAISEAHAVGIVHRDLKPSNLFISRQPDGSALLKVVDFGISKSLQTGTLETNTLTGARVALGSPHYMSPEQVRDARRVDARTDVWALGVILFELVAGRPAFQADSYPGIFAAITADVPPSLSSLRPEVAAGLERIVARCLEREPSLRYQRAEELARALEDYRAREINYDELVAPKALEHSPHTLRAAADSLPSGARPAASLPLRAEPSAPTVPITQTKLSAAEIRGQMLESSAPSQDVPAIAHSSGSLQSGTHTQRSGPSESDASHRVPGAGIKLAIALFGIAIALAIVWQVGQRQASKVLPAPSASPSSSLAAEVVMTIESSPAGAHVSEGNRELGLTPLRLSLSSGEAQRPRTFVLTLPGYRPHVFERAPGPEATSVRVDLVRAAAEEVAPSAPPAASVAVPPRPTPRAPAARPHSPPAASAPVEVKPDIRLVR